MSVLCSNCGCSLANNWVLEAKAKEHRHSPFCKTCAKLHARGTKEDIIIIRYRHSSNIQAFNMPATRPIWDNKTELQRYNKGRVLCE